MFVLLSWKKKSYMAIFSFFKTPKHQTFNYKPRYYDPDKERLDAIIRNAKGEGSTDPEDIKARISMTFQRRMVPKMTRQKAARRSNIILVIVMIILFLFSYFLMKIYLPEIIESVEN